MYDPQSTSSGSIMPAYQWLVLDEHDRSNVQGKMEAMVNLGVPYTDEDIASAQLSMEEQATAIVERLKEDPDLKRAFEENEKSMGADYIPMKDREIVAMIAYLQRLGTDIKVKETGELLSENK
jgi:cytochrome c oxidase cbb3-type subunit I/II